MIPDKHGRYTDCHFLQENKYSHKLKCEALKDFYNSSSQKHKCKGCTFFMTDEEFNERREKRDSTNEQS